MVEAAATDRPVEALFDAVAGQPAAVAQLRASARRPVHAYLLHGPRGSGKLAAARGFAAALLCPQGGCGVCSTCQRTLAGTHPDVVMVERSGAALSVEDASTIVAKAQRQPLEASRQVLLVTDIHLAVRAAPALLKTVEEPPPFTIFVLVGEELPPSMITIASRCVEVAFEPVSPEAIAAWLMLHGSTEDVARSVAEAAGGRLDRARLLATDPDFTDRVALWHSVPSRLDGTGATVVVLAAELLASAEGTLGMLRLEHAAEVAALADQAEAVGARGVPGRKELDERHKREERRWRTDELRSGLATLAAAYRDRLVASVGAGGGTASPGVNAESRHLAAAADSIDMASRSLGRNVNEGLLFEALLCELSRSTG